MRSHVDAEHDKPTKSPPNLWRGGRRGGVPRPMAPRSADADGGAGDGPAAPTIGDGDTPSDGTGAVSSGEGASDGEGDDSDDWSASTCERRELLAGLHLYPRFLDAHAHAECVRLIEDELLPAARRGDFGKCYVTRPPHWESTRQGRAEAIHFGALVKFNKAHARAPAPRAPPVHPHNSAANPGAQVLAGARVPPLPPHFDALLDSMEAAAVFPPSQRPDTCTVNAYAAGDWIPPHVDSPAFDVPFVVLSLRSAQRVVFGEGLGCDHGVCDGGAALTLPRGSLLRIDAPAAGPACQHAVPPATERRISLIFRRLSDLARSRAHEIRADADAAACARATRRRERKAARRRGHRAEPSTERRADRSPDQCET